MSETPFNPQSGRPEDPPTPRRLVPLAGASSESPGGATPPAEGMQSQGVHAGDATSSTPDPPHARPARTSPRSGGEQRSDEPYSGVLLSRISWLLFALILILMVRWMLPGLIEEVRYGLVRGEQRAKYEVASTVFKDDPLRALSQYYAGVSEIAGPSVVHINTTSAGEEQREDELSHFLAPNAASRTARAAALSSINPATL